MTHTLQIVQAGKALNDATKVLIMLHGRGGSAEDILGLAAHLKVEDFALLAPQATQHTWYPHSFMAPTETNEPWLSSALDTVKATVQLAEDAGISSENIFFFGFSQGACLSLEFLARNGKRYGGAAAIIGGLIGEEIDQRPYQGDFATTPIYLGTSNPDFHVPLQRVQETEKVLTQMNASVTLEVFEHIGHTIHPQQIDWINRFVL